MSTIGGAALPSPNCAENLDIEESYKIDSSLQRVLDRSNANVSAVLFGQFEAPTND
jgi:hypothetical protein